jgi:two-component system sensor histidine kinase KdpD
MRSEPARPDPDAILARIKAEEQPTKGRLRIYLGAAPGVGKTFAMLQEAHRRKDRGTDVVIGFVETHKRPHTIEQIGNLEIVPPLEIPYKGVIVREMDTDAVIARHPQVALVDELAHTNVEGSRHHKRYEDVQDLLDAGITVISTLNIQHIESLNDTVKQVTGIAVRETVPDWVLDVAEQVELIDMAPEALIQRMKHGNIYPPEQAKQALENFFTAGNLTALRDMALRATAREVEQQLSRYMRDTVDDSGTPVAINDEANRGPRATLTMEEDRQLRANLQLADELGATVVRLRGNITEELIAHVRSNRVTQLIIGNSAKGRWTELLHGSVTHELLRNLPGIDIHVMGDGSVRRRRE